MLFYVYEDGDLIGEEEVDLDNHSEITEIMEEYFQVDEWERDDSESGEIMIMVSDLEYMVNKKY